jgi:hypothetical protein
MGERPIAERGALKENIACEIQRGAARDANRDLRINMALGMSEQELVADGREDNAAHDWEMEISVSSARHAPGISGSCDQVTPAFGANVKIDPPHGDAGHKRYEERSTRDPRPFKLGKGCPRN